MRNIKRFAVLIMAVAMVVTGCGKAESTKGLKSVKDDTTTENVVVSQEEKKSEEITKSTIKGLEEADRYKTDRVESFRKVFEQNGMEYELTENKLAIHGEAEDIILDTEYESNFTAYSATDYPNSTLNTLIFCSCRFHPERGISEQYLNVMYGLIQASNDNKMKEEIDSVNKLSEQFAGQRTIAGDMSFFELTENTASTWTAEFACYEIIPFVEEEIETVYLEFDSLDEYTALKNELYSGYRAYTNEIQGNKFAFVIESDWKTSVDVVTREPYEWVVTKIGEACDLLNVEDEKKQIFINDTFMWGRLTHWISDHNILEYRMDFNMDHSILAQYPFEYVATDYWNFYMAVPVKVEGLLNG